MKTNLLWLALLGLSLSLFPQTSAKIIRQTDQSVTIGLGSSDGIEVGMKGRLKAVERSNGKDVMLTIGFAEVRQVSDKEAVAVIIQLGSGFKPENAQFFEVTIKRTPPPPTNRPNKPSGQEQAKKTTSETSTVRNPVPTEETSTEKPQSRLGLSSIKSELSRLFRQGRNDDVLALAQKSLAGSPDDEELKEWIFGIGLIQSAVLVPQQYIDFRKQYPNSQFFAKIKEKLYGQYYQLPPEQELDQAVTIELNNKNYFDVTFRNGHRMVYIPEKRVFVDKFEVSNQLFLLFLSNAQQTAKSITLSTMTNYPFCCPSYPAIVSYDEAQAYCNKNGMRLPTDEEWQYFAAKDQSMKYPWGSVHPDDNGAFRANYESLYDGFVEFAPVDKFELGDSVFGIRSLAGNAKEWVQGKICKGGSFLSSVEDLQITAKNEVQIHVGFRCMKEVGK